MGKDRDSSLESELLKTPDDMVEEQVRAIYMHAPTSNAVIVCIATLYILILSPRVETSLILYWAVTLYASALYRLSLWHSRSKNPQRKSSSEWMNRYIVGCALVGASWSLIYPLSYTADDTLVSTALYILAFGAISSAVPILAASMRAFIVYTYPQALMIGHAFLRQQDSVYYWLALAVAIYLVMTTLFTRNANRSLMTSIRLQAHNQTLIEQLSQEVEHREALIAQGTVELREKNRALASEVLEREHTQQLQARQKDILELISRGGVSLEQILEEIILLTESQIENVKGAILLLEGKSLCLGAAPNLPEAYVAQIDGLKIIPGEGPFGTTTKNRQRVIVENIQSSPLWKGNSQLDINLPFSACWLEPVIDAAGNVIGIFSLHHAAPAAPEPDDIRLIETLAPIAGIAIERSLTETRLQQSATVFKSTLEGVMITDADGNILDVNNAFENITGFSREEVTGRTPAVLQSGRHDSKFYDEMRQSLRQSGQWRGEVWNRRKSGDIYLEWLNISTIFDSQGTLVNYVAVFSDITSIKRSQEELIRLAHHDPLTGLPNRLLFNSRLEQAIKHARRNTTKLAVLFVDLDRFKSINDSLGHAMGDILLKQLALRITDSVRLVDTVARISGDEFIVLLEDIKNPDNTAIAVEKIMAVFREPFLLDGHEVRITASVGISLYPNDGETANDLLRNADAAMYNVKEEGRNTYQFYTKEMTNSAFERIVIENALREALGRNEFHLLYQPQFRLRDGKITGAEALIRWSHPELGAISPDKFIPLAEDNGLIHDIGAWVLKAACLQGLQWLENGFDFGHIAVNVAPPQLQRGDFVNQTRAILEDTGLPPHRLELEVTEGFIMQNTEQAIAQLEALRELGLGLAIDDFGTGYSSMSYLKMLPIDKLKIDQSFIHDIPFDADDMAITEAVIALGKALDLKVIAEGVETEEQANFLREKGSQQAQGYLYGRPMEGSELEARFAGG